MKHSKLHFFLIFILFLTLFPGSCRQEEQYPIPDVYVNFSINLFDDPEFYMLRTQGTSVVVTSSTIGAYNVGYDDNGIIIYNAGGDEFYAFDRTCPFDIPESVAIDVDGSGTFGTCPRCNSVYIFLSMGLPATGSASKWPLRNYRTFYNPSTGDLFVSN